VIDQLPEVGEKTELYNLTWGIDIQPSLMRLNLMRGIKFIMALLTATLWLPAIERCELVAAELLPSFLSDGEPACECPPGCDCNKDACRSLEQNLPYQTYDTIVSSVMVEVAIIDPVSRCEDNLRQPATPAFRPRRSAGLYGDTRPWQFERRAAPAPRSPTLA